VYLGLAGEKGMRGDLPITTGGVLNGDGGDQGPKGLPGDKGGKGSPGEDTVGQSGDTGEKGTEKKFIQIF
jgi:hypothetical protein